MKMIKRIFGFLLTLALFACAAPLLQPASAADTAPSTYQYALLTSSGDLVFLQSKELHYSSDDDTAQTVKDVSGTSWTGTLFTGIDSQYCPRSWRNYASKIKKVYVAPGSVVTPRSMNNWFWKCSAMSSFDASGFDTSGVTDMASAFGCCGKLKTLDLRGFDTSKVTSMNLMFYHCANLTSLDLSSFNTSRVTTMIEMFQGCGSLKSLDLSSFDTSNVTDMDMIFADCHMLESIDLSSFRLTKLTSTNKMFYGCTMLKTLDMSRLDTSGVRIMISMFEGCSSLTSLDLSGFDTRNTGSMIRMFADCSSLKSLDLSGFDTSSLASIEQMFTGCSSLETLDISGFNTSKVTVMYRLFKDCSSLKSIDLSSFDTSAVTNMREMFDGCSSLTSLDLGNFNTSKTTTMQWMFRKCSALRTLDLTSFDTTALENMEEMFRECLNLDLLDLSSFDTCSLSSMDNAFYEAEIARLKLGNKFTNWAGGPWMGLYDEGGIWVKGNMVRTGFELQKQFPKNPDRMAGLWTHVLSEEGPELNGAVLEEAGVRLEWNGYEPLGEPALLYKVYRKNSSGSWIEIGQTEELSYTDEAPLMGTNTYRIQACNKGYLGGCYWSVYSGTASAVFNPFTDVETGSAAFTRISWAYNNGIVSGTSKTTFSPGSPCTRAQFALMLYKLYGKPSVSGMECPFTDIGSLTSNNRKAIIWAYNSGIVGGTSATTFSPKNNITRVQLVLMLYKAAGSPKVSGSTPFTDIGSLSSNNRKAILWAYQNGIVGGTSATTFSPKNNCTRGQLVTMLYKYNKLLGLIPS